MASYQQLNYCKKCKKNVALNEKGQCSKCLSTQIKKSWTVRFRYIDEFGKETQKRLTGFENKKSAQDGMFQFNLEHRTKHEKIKNLTFLELYTEYEKYLLTKNKATTHYDFVSKCKTNILPFFKNVDVIKITPKMLLDWQNTLTGYSYAYKCHMRTCLNSMFNYAERYYNIPNQLKKVEKFRRLEPKREMQIWSPEEFSLAMQHVDNFEYKTYYTALYYTGARKGEMLATYWEDWDFQNKTLSINKSVSNKATGASWIVTTTKNASSVRKIRINDKLIDMLKQLKEIKLNNGTLGKFTFGTDSPLPQTTVCRYFSNAAKKANVKQIRIHDLRHSHASLLISQGVSIVSVAKRLGHSGIEQTLNTYAHMMPTEEDNLIKKLDSVL